MIIIIIIRIVLPKIGFFVVPKIENNIPAGRNEECTRCGFPPPFDARREGERGRGRERERVRRERKEKSLLLDDYLVPYLAFYFWLAQIISP